MLSAFRAYDIRGIYPDEINEDLAAAAARAFVRYFKVPAVVVGHDMRLSSPLLEAAVVAALIDEGVYIVNVGLVPSPVLDFTMVNRSLPACIWISASHNPPEYNGLKMRVLEQRMVVQVSAGHGMEEIALKTERILAGNFRRNLRNGKPYELNALPNYLEFINKAAQGIGGLTVVADYGNGMGGITAQPALDALKSLSVTHLFTEPDGTFPNHQADPHHLENFETLISRVRQKHADIGLFFDGDADRVAFIDERGEVVAADHVVALLAENLLKDKQNQGAKVYHDHRASRDVVAAIKRCGGVPCRLPVGNPHYKRALARHGGLLAGENSSHLMFPETGGSDDALYSAIQVLKVLSQSRQPLSQLLEKYSHHARLPEFVIPRAAGTSLEKLHQKLISHFKGAGVSWLDGLTLEHPDWWLNVRASNTEPVLRVNIEAKNAELLARKSKDLKRLLKA